MPCAAAGRPADVAVPVEDGARAAGLGAGGRASWLASCGGACAVAAVPRRCRGRPGRRRRGRGPGPGRPAPGRATRRPRRSSSARSASACCDRGEVRWSAALAAYAPSVSLQLVALGQRRGVGVLRHRHRPADGVEPRQVGVHGRRAPSAPARALTRRAPRAGGRGDLGHAPRGEVTQGRAARLQLGAQRPGPGLVVRRGRAGWRRRRSGRARPGRRPAPAGRAGRRRPRRAVARASDVGDARVEPVEHRRARRRAPGPARGRRGRAPARPRRAAARRRAWRSASDGSSPAGRAATRRARRTAGRPRAARRPGLRRDALPRRTRRRGGCAGGVEPPQTRVESRSSSVGPTRPESQVATSRSWRSATAFHSAIESSTSPVYAAASGGRQGRLVEPVELGLALVAPGARAPRGSAARRWRRAAGRAGRAPPVPWRSFGRGDHGVRPYTGSGGAGARPGRRPARCCSCLVHRPSARISSRTPLTNRTKSTCVLVDARGRTARR